MNRARFRFVAAFAAFAVPTLVHAEQAVISDVMYTHAADTTSDSHYRVKPQAGSPTDWTKPIDYSQGSVHVLLEVKSKPPGDTPTKFQICFEGTPDYACTDQSPTYTKPGKIEWDSKFANFWYGGDVDWSKGANQIALILKDTNNNKPQGDPKYVPTDLHVQITLLSAGATFAPPPAAGSGGASGGAGEAGRAGSGGRPFAGAGGRDAAASGGSAAVSGRGGAGAGSGGGGSPSDTAGSGPRASGAAGIATPPSAGTRAGSAGRAGGSAGGSAAETSAAGAGTATETSTSPATGTGAEPPAKQDDSGCNASGKVGASNGALALITLWFVLRCKRKRSFP